MLYSKEIVPCFEAAEYLSQRFTNDRVSKRIKDFSGKTSMDTGGELWESITKIQDIEKELDKRFEPDELMLRYFSPLQTVNSLSSKQITLGELLLCPTVAIKEPVSYDSIVEFYSDAEQDVILSQFSTHLFTAFEKDEPRETISVKDLIAITEKYFIKSDDKWLFIDMALNPLQHLEKLRPLVTAVADAIVELSAELDDLLRSAAEALGSIGAPEHVLKKLGLHFKPKEINPVNIHPSLMHFNVCSISATTNTDNNEKIDIQVFLGIHSYFIIGGKGNKVEDPDAFLNTLKLISDPTRFNMLHDLCDNNSYGQELAQKFKCTRSAMYYHLEKLFENRLIDREITCYRMLYSLNKRNVYNKFNAMRDYILKGWKPEDDENKAEGEEEKE